MCLDPNQRPTCEEALTHQWLNDKSNLESKAAEKRRKSAQIFLAQSMYWNLGQQFAFFLSLIVMLGSYSALITYLFNIGKPSAIFQDFLVGLKLEFFNLYSQVYGFVDNLCEVANEFVTETVKEWLRTYF